MILRTITRPAKLLNVKGLSLIEILISVTILAVTLAGASRMAVVYGNYTRVSRNLEQMQAEHTAIKRLLGAIPGGQASFVMCGRPHPWVDYVPSQDRCVAGTNALITAGAEANWTTLSDVYYTWANTPVNDGHHLSPVLSAGTYNSLVVPKLQLAGCLNCHDGGVNSGGTPDFQSFAAMSASPTPFVSYLGLTSKLGRRLLKNPVNLQNILLGSDNVSEHSGQLIHTLNLSLSSGDICRAPTIRRGVSKVFVVQNKAVCPTGISTPPRCLACNTTEYCDPTTCIYYCGSFAAPVDSQTPAVCTSWTQKADCYLPTPPCPVSNAVGCTTAGQTVTNCQEFQNSLTCGFGSTTWRCSDNSNPLAAQSNVVLYSLITSYLQSDTANSRQLSSQGALP